MLKLKGIMKVFEVKIAKKWWLVRASSIKSLNDWTEKNHIKDWRMVGMQSRSEMKENSSLFFVG